VPRGADVNARPVQDSLPSAVAHRIETTPFAASFMYGCRRPRAWTGC